MTLNEQQVAEIAAKTAEAVKAKAAEENRKPIFGEPVEKPSVKAVNKLMAEIRAMALPTEVREMAKLTDNFALTRKWLNALRTQRMGDSSQMAQVQSEIRAMSEGTAGDGGYLVPEEFSAVIIKKRDALIKMRKYATVIPMTTDKLHVPYESSLAIPTWEAEANNTTPVTPTFLEIALTPFKLKALTVVSNELLRDASVQVINYLADQFARRLAVYEDKAFWVGAGTTEPTGLRSMSVTSVTQAGANLAYSDVLNLYMALPEQYRANGCFVTGPKGIQLVMGLTDTYGRPIFQPSYEQGKPGTLFGRPLIEVADWPTNLTVGSVTNTTDIWFSDLSSFIIGDRQGIEMAISTERYFELDQTAIKAICRSDSKPTFVDGTRKLISVK